MGLLDGFSEFVKTPEGQGLLSAVAGGMAGARRGAPINSLGIGGLAGLRGYTGAIDQAARQDEQNAVAQYRNAQIKKMQEDQARQAAQEAARAQALTGLPPEQRQAVDAGLPFADIWKRNNPEPAKPQLVEMADPADPLRTRKSWIRPGETEGPVVGYGALPEILDPRVQAAKRDVAAAGRSVTNTNTNVFNNTKDDFKNERDLRNDFAGLPTTKAFNEVQSAYDQIQTAIKSESPAGDLAAATKIMKILDPGSVVRESELGMAMAATGAMDRMQNYVQMTMSGQKLTPNQRKDFGDLATKLYTAAADRYDTSAKEYQGVATDYNLNPGRVAKPSKRSAMSPGGWSATVVK